jgi:hypothetical protein
VKVREVYRSFSALFHANEEFGVGVEMKEAF